MELRLNVKPAPIGRFSPFGSPTDAGIDPETKVPLSEEELIQHLVFQVELILDKKELEEIEAANDESSPDDYRQVADLAVDILSEIHTNPGRVVPKSQVILLLRILSLTVPDKVETWKTNFKGFDRYLSETQPTKRRIAKKVDRLTNLYRKVIENDFSVIVFEKYFDEIDEAIKTRFEPLDEQTKKAFFRKGIKYDLRGSLVEDDTFRVYLDATIYLTDFLSKLWNEIEDSLREFFLTQKHEKTVTKTVNDKEIKIPVALKVRAATSITGVNEFLSLIDGDGHPFFKEVFEEMVEKEVMEAVKKLKDKPYQQLERKSRKKPIFTNDGTIRFLMTKEAYEVGKIKTVQANRENRSAKELEQAARDAAIMMRDSYQKKFLMGPPRINWAYQGEKLTEQEKEELKEIAKDKSLPTEVRRRALKEYNAGYREVLIGKCDKVYSSPETGRPVTCGAIWIPGKLWPVWLPHLGKWMCPTCKQKYTPVPFEGPTKGMTDLDPATLFDQDAQMVAPAVAMPDFPDFVEMGDEEDRIPGSSPKIDQYKFNYVKEPSSGPRKQQPKQKQKPQLDIGDIISDLEAEADLSDYDALIDFDPDDLFAESVDPDVGLVARFMNPWDDE